MAVLVATVVRTVHVLFGTESGNAQGLADRVGDALRAADLEPKVIDMMDFSGPDLENVGLLLVVTSTYGNGDPPSNAEVLHAYLMKKCPPLPGVAFSVCALGDTTYERFAQCGKDFDRRLQELGAARLVDRQDCDVDYEAPFEAWLAKVVPALVERASATPTESNATRAIPAPPASQSRGTDPLGTRRNPATATVLENVNLNGADSTKETRHVVLAVSGLALEPGDSVGIWAENDPELVERVAAAAGAKLDETIQLGTESLTLRAALSTRLEIQLPDARLVDRLTPGLSAEQKQEALRSHHVIDLLDARGGRALGDTLPTLLRTMAPRLYSLASSPQKHPNEVHLTVDVIRYDLSSWPRMGVASRQLALRAPPGTKLSVFAHKTPGFRLPVPDKDIVMIGPGTGVAPFRAFLQERSAQHATGRAWLFFGARNGATDFLYAADFERLREEGVLHRVDTAFSRDQAEKQYVQTRMREHRGDLREWIRAGAVVYVCGDAKRMAPDVHDALIEILADGSEPNAARAELDRMAQEGRYCRDVY